MDHATRFHRPDIAREPNAYLAWLIEHARAQHGQATAEQPIAVLDVPRRWFVIVTELNRERSVCEDLRRAGLEPYAPMKRWFRNGGGVVSRPLLAGYVFAGLAEACGGLHALMAPRHAKSVLPRPDAPQAVPTHEVDRLKMMEAGGDFDQTVASVPRAQPSSVPSRASLAWIVPGAWIVVKDGPFSGCLGLIKVVMAERYRVEALIPMMGRKVVELRFYQFRAAS